MSSLCTIFFVFFCVCCLCFCNGGYVPQFFVCSSNASLYRCMAECRWLLKEKASRAPIKTIPLVFRSRNFDKVLVGITLMTQWQSHSWELAIWYPSFICCNRAPPLPSNYQEMHVVCDFNPLMTISVIVWIKYEVKCELSCSRKLCTSQFSLFREGFKPLSLL